VKKNGDFRFPSFDEVLKRAYTTLPANHQSLISNHKSKIGLTLIEVLLAVVILGIGAGVLLLATARCLAVARKARHYSTARTLLLRIEAKNPLNRFEIEEGKTDGNFDDFSGYRWEREVEPVEDENQLGLYTVRTRVFWSDRGRGAFEEVAGLHYIKPKESAR